MKKLLIILACFAISPNLFTQVVFEEKDALISKTAFSKKVTTQFNYLILGENSPQQGISATLNEKKSNLKINGLLYSGISGIYTIEADLAASNGIYFFDQENGSEQGKITLNYYNRLWSSSSFKKLKSRDRAHINLQIEDLIAKSKTNFDSLYHRFKSIKFNDNPNTKKDQDSIFKLQDSIKIYESLKCISYRYINHDQNLGYDKLKTKDFNGKTYDGKNNVITKKIRHVGVYNPNNYNFLKLIKDYEDARDFILYKLEDSINSIEFQKTEKQWTWEKTLFLGISPFFERQSFKRFAYDNTQTFSEMFALERGNIYGTTISLNFALNKGKGNKSRFKPQTIFTRLSLSLNRASNISNFRNTTLEITGPIGNDVNGNPIVFSNNDNAFVGDSVYEFGFGRRLVWDGYIYPFEAPIGLFGSIGYEKISFNRGSSIEDKELYPMRVGLLFSLVNKDSKKPNITVQAFIDRTDLNLNPNGEDNDLRFGLGIGLPVNF